MSTPSIPIAGHGSLIYMELDPTGSPGSFTLIAQLAGDVGAPGVKRTATNITPHQLSIDTYIVGVRERDPVKFPINYLYDDPTHDHLTGLQAAQNAATPHGFRFLGPPGNSPGANKDEVITSAYVISFLTKSPVRNGVRSADVTLQATGPYKQDGVIFGTTGI